MLFIIYNRHDNSVVEFTVMAPNLYKSWPNNVFLPYSGPFLILQPTTTPPRRETQEADYDEEIVVDTSRVIVPLEHNLRALLVTVTGTEALDRVTQVKLRVIARDVPLQHLSVHIPALRELILDGSIVSTLRDLGCGLRNLRILRVNRCGLNCIDGMAGLEHLEELYAADNSIENPMPCAFFPNIRVIDLKRNKLKNVPHTLTFLSLCEKLEHIHLEGNDEIWQFPKYRQTVKSLLPALRSLDGITYTDDGEEEKSNTLMLELSPTANTDHRPQKRPVELKRILNQPKANTLSQQLGNSSPRFRPAPDSNSGFIIRFPPKVFLNTPNT